MACMLYQCLLFLGDRLVAGLTPVITHVVASRKDLWPLLKLAARYYWNLTRLVTPYCLMHIVLHYCP